MNKKIIAAAVASAFVAAAPAAQAEITVYSHIQFELSQFDFDGSAGDVTRVGDYERGRLGVKGGHDLGGGLKSFAIAEFDFEGGKRDAEFGGNTKTCTATDTTGDTVTCAVSTTRAGFRVREINAGLSGSFGSIALGTVKSAYKYSGGVKYDPFVTTAIEQRGNAGMSKGTVGHNGFLNNAFVYNIKAGIAQIHATYSLDDTSRDTDGGNNDDGEYSLGVTFGDKMWEAGVAIADQGLSGSGNDSATKLFGKMAFGIHNVLLQWENVETSSTEESDYLMLSYQVKVGKGLVVLTYGDRDSNANSNDADNLTLGYIHKFNKETRVFAGYQTYDQEGSSNDRDVITLGIRVDI